MKNPKGQGLVEALLSIPILFAAGAILLLLLYRGVLFFLIDNHLHESLLCMQYESQQICKDMLNKQVHKILLFRESFSVELRTNSLLTTGKAIVHIRPPLLIEKKLRKENL